MSLQVEVSPASAAREPDAPQHGPADHAVDTDHAVDADHAAPSDRSQKAVPEPIAPYEDYRELSSLAVVSAVCGALSLGLVFLIQLLDPILFALFPALGIVLSIRALRQLREVGPEMSGGPLAWAGGTVSALALVGGWATQAYIYATEVPPDCVRLSYAQLQPADHEPPGTIPPSAEEFQGKRVFIRGFVYPAVDQVSGIRRLILCRDNGDCCFGGQPKLTDMIEVTFRPNITYTFNAAPLRVSGTFRIQRGVALHGLGQVFYHLDEAEYHP